jgi:hypothetical protein
VGTKRYLRKQVNFSETEMAQLLNDAQAEKRTLSELIRLRALGLCPCLPKAA